jgi:predicted aspartyl protease
MPCLSGTFNPAIGPIIQIGVFAANAFVPTQQITPFPALIDTGASSTCISPRIIQAVGLQPIGMRPMVSATHSVPVNAYLVDLIVLFGGQGFIIKATQVMEFSPGGNPAFEILVGRDIICKGTLSLSFDGHFSLSL